MHTFSHTHTHTHTHTHIHREKNKALRAGFAGRNNQKGDESKDKETAAKKKVWFCVCEHTYIFVFTCPCKHTCVHLTSLRPPIYIACK